MQFRKTALDVNPFDVLRKVAEHFIATRLTSAILQQVKSSTRIWMMEICYSQKAHKQLLLNTMAFIQNPRGGREAARYKAIHV